MPKQAKGGKKNRKQGRCTNSPSHKRYVAEMRDKVNARKRANRLEREQAKKAKRTPRVARGTTRSERRKAWLFAIDFKWLEKDRESFRDFELRKAA